MRLYRTPYVLKYDAQDPRYPKDMEVHWEQCALAMNVYLNDDFEGGGTYFPRWKYSTGRAAPGRAILYPGGISHQHGVSADHLVRHGRPLSPELSRDTIGASAQSTPRRPPRYGTPRRRAPGGAPGGQRPSDTDDMLNSGTRTGGIAARVNQSFHSRGRVRSVAPTSDARRSTSSGE